MIITLTGADFSLNNIGAVLNPLAKATLMENTLINENGVTSSSNDFFTYKEIPVTAGNKIIVRNARNVVFFNASNTKVTWVNATSGSISPSGGTLLYPYVLQVPANATSMAYCAKYSELSSSEATITRANSDGSFTIDEVVVDVGSNQIKSVPSTNGSFALDTYYSICGIPVNAGQSYKSTHGRNFIFLNSSGGVVSSGSFKNTSTVTVPSGATTISVTFKYSEVDKSKASITLV